MTLFFSDTDISESRLERRVGSKSKSAIKGSIGLFIQAIRADDAPTDLVSAKANFEFRQKGLIIYVSKSSNRWVVPIPTSDLVKVTLRSAADAEGSLDIIPMTLLLDTQNIDLALTTTGSNETNLRKLAKSIEEMVPASEV